MPKVKLTGSFVALITPFNRDGTMDFEAFRSLLAFHEHHGTAAVLIMGSTGETSLLDPEERRAIIVETAKMKSARMPIFYGCTGNSTASTIDNVRFAREHGADGAILAAPAYICASEADIEHFFLTLPTRPICRWTSTTIHRGSRPTCTGTSCCGSSVIPTTWCTRNPPPGRTGRPGACRQTRRGGDLLRQPQSWPGCCRR